MNQTSAKPRRRSQTRHLAILSAAAELAGERGYRAASLEGVAERAGAGKQTIYRWWATKPALFVEVYGHLASRERLEIYADTPRETLRLRLVNLFELFRKTPAGTILAGLVSDAADDPQTRDAVEQGLVLARGDLLTDPLRRGIGSVDFPAETDVELVSEIIVALIWKRLLTRPQTLDQGFAGTLVQIAMGEPC